jgi:hypothetical protein
MENKEAMEEILRSLEELRKPFDVRLIEFRPGTPKDDTCIPLAYVPRMAYLDRLYQVCPGMYQILNPSVHVTPTKVLVAQSVFIYGLEFADVGEAALDQPDAAPSAQAQALKRACAQFGLGSYLYNGKFEPVPYKYKKIQAHSLVLAADWYLSQGYPVDDSVLDELEDLRNYKPSYSSAPSSKQSDDNFAKIKLKKEQLERFNQVPMSLLNTLSLDQLSEMQQRFMNRKDTGETKEQILADYQQGQEPAGRSYKRPWK